MNPHLTRTQRAIIKEMQAGRGLYRHGKDGLSGVLDRKVFGDKFRYISRKTMNVLFFEDYITPFDGDSDYILTPKGRAI